MSEHIVTARDGALGIIVLNRPKAINALSFEMIVAITSALDAWAGDDGVGAVLFEGRGERGFCAGGDVRTGREQVLAGKPELVDRFLTHEYAMDTRIATYAKPVVALQHGIVMGGGIGISGHASHRIATDDARFAMPEAAIGLMCDVGVNAILAKAPMAPALAFLLTGAPWGAADALALGLSDAIVRRDDLAAVRDAVVAAANQANPRAALDALLGAVAMDAGPGLRCADAVRLADAFGGDDVDSIRTGLLARAKSDAAAAEWAATLDRLCPTSLAAILGAQHAARARPVLAEIFARDLRLCSWLARRPDFAEGVRAVLVDKDNGARWLPSAATDVDAGAIAKLVG